MQRKETTALADWIGRWCVVFFISVGEDSHFYKWRATNL